MKCAKMWLSKIRLWIVVAMVFLFFSETRSSGQEISSCCAKATGSCKSVCIKLSLVEIAADTELRDDRLSNVHKFCSSELIEFWECMNQTIKEVVRGSGWWGRVCCGLANVGTCQRACAVASSETPLLAACRRSDEHAFFSCIDRQNHGQECCSNTQSLSCRDACKDIFRSRQTPTREHRAKVRDLCEENSPKVMQCVRNYTKVTPASNPLKYLHCCEESTNNVCRDTCKKALKTKSSTQEILDVLDNGCGPALPHDPLWQCFLRADQSSRDNEVSNIDRLGIDSAKLHCCHKAKTSHCKKLCLNTFTNDWVGRWERFDNECLKKSQEAPLLHCIDEVEEPCELGCDGLSYCTNFNNRPTEFFRSCNAHADVAAHYDVALWQSQGYLNLPGLQLPVKNVSKCSPQVWKAVACTLQIKPCARLEHANRICRDDCLTILSHCMDWTKVDGDHNAATLCDKLSPEDSDTPCILQNFMEPSDNPYIEPYDQVSSPCKGDPCNITQVCTINRNCPFGRSCNAYQCVNGCPLGEVSQFLVPEGTYVRIPISNSQKGCQKICHCSGRSFIDKCQPLPCISYDSCNLGNKHILHGSIFYMECNICTCFAGEIVCSKKQCDYIEDSSMIPYTKLPCNCPPHHVPVCGSNGNSYPSSCLAKCAGLGDADIEFGACSTRQICAYATCPINSTCLSNPNVCLSLMHRPCNQYICVNSSTCNAQPNDPVCDTDGQTHQTPCHLLLTGKKLDYFGTCINKCLKNGLVCGINGNTYSSECAAWSDYVSVDYEGPCVAVGLITDFMNEKCILDHITCPPLAKANCIGFTPPGACCPVCGGAIKLLYSRKQIDRALYALRGQSLTALTLKAVLKSLQRHVQVAECVVRGYVTVELDLFVMVQSTEKKASDLQLEACVREAEKLASLVRKQSARIASELSLSSLTVAIEVHTLPSTANSFRNRFSSIFYFICISLSLSLTMYIVKVS